MLSTFNHLKLLRQWRSKWLSSSLGLYLGGSGPNPLQLAFASGLHIYVTGLTEAGKRHHHTTNFLSHVTDGTRENIFHERMRVLARATASLR